ncbi:MAG: hypothetical protein H7Y14_05995 [Burkholderiales bacterium]|nr:hypothetical protein [Burkholderiales bacterium]
MRSIAPALFATACALAACSVPTVTLKKPALGPSWPDAGTPPATIASREHARLKL